MKRRSCQVLNENNKRVKAEPKQNQRNKPKQDPVKELFTVKYPLNYEYIFERQFSIIKNWLLSWSQKRISSNDEDSRESMDTFVECFLLLGSYHFNIMEFLHDVSKKLGFDITVMDFATERSMKSIMSRFSHSIDSEQVKTQTAENPNDSLALLKSKTKTEKIKGKNSLKPDKRSSIKNHFLPSTDKVYSKVTLQKNSFIVFDDVHLVSSQQDRAFWQGVNFIIKKSKRPVILITTIDHRDLVIPNLECDINICNFHLDSQQIRKRTIDQIANLADKENLKWKCNDEYIELKQDIPYDRICHTLQWYEDDTSHTEQGSPKQETAFDDLESFYKRTQTLSTIDMILSHVDTHISPESLDNAEAYLNDTVEVKFSDELIGMKPFLDYFIQDNTRLMSSNMDYLRKQLDNSHYISPKLDQNLVKIHKDLQATIFIQDHFSVSFLPKIRMELIPSLNEIFTVTKLERESSRKRRCLSYFDKIGIFIEEYQKKIFENSLISL